MSWHRAAILVACGFLLQCPTNVNTSSRQSYREALRRRLSSVAWCPPPQQPPCIRVPYPYLQPGAPIPGAYCGASNIITQNTAAGWPEYRIKVPLYMGRPIKTNIIVELPLYMFPQPGRADAVNNAVSTISSTSDSSMDCHTPDAQGSSQSVEDQNVIKEDDLTECDSDEVIKNEPSVSMKDNTFEDNNSPDNKSPEDNICPPPSTNHFENKPSVLEPNNEAYLEQIDDCTDDTSISNKPIVTSPDSSSPESACVKNSPESINNKVDLEEPASPDGCGLTGNNDPVVVNHTETSDDTHNSNVAEKVSQDDAAIEAQPQTEVETSQDTECSTVDDSDLECCTEDDTTSKELLEPCTQPEEEPIASEDAADCSSPRTDDGTEMASSIASECTSTD